MDEITVVSIESKRKVKDLVQAHKKWTATLVQNDIIKHVETLYLARRLEHVYPEPFASLRAYRPYPKDVDVVLEVSEDKQVSVKAHHDLDHTMGAWYRELFDTRYQGEAMGTAMQAATTRALIPYMKRLEKGEIKIFAFRGEDAYCWRKLPWNLLGNRTLKLPEYWPQGLSRDSTLLVPRLPFQSFLDLFEEHAPAWHSMLLRMRNSEAFCAWMGSLMDRDCDNHQFLYMQGEGGDGKGTVIRALQAIFNDRLMFTQNIPEDSGALRFFAANLEGKRILACPEMPGGELFTSYLKSLSGGDVIAVEPKGKESRQAENHLRVLMVSNFWPKIPDNEAARRRIILILMLSIGADNIELGYEAKLVDEAQLFFSIAYYCFKNMPKAGQIEQDRSVYEKNFETLYGDELALLDHYFHVYPEAQAEKERDLPSMTVSEFSYYVKEKVKTMSPRRVRELLAQGYGVGEVKVVKLIGSSSERRVMRVTARKSLHAWESANIDRKE